MTETQEPPDVPPEGEDIGDSDAKLREQGKLSEVERRADEQAAEETEEDRLTDAQDPADDEPDDPDIPDEPEPEDEP